MKEFPIEDYLTEEKAQKKPARQITKKDRTLGKEILKAIEAFDMVMYELHRPLDSGEAKRLETLVDEAQKCTPASEDIFMMRKVLDMMERANEAIAESGTESHFAGERASTSALLGYRSNPFEMAFKIGMAYERLQSKAKE